MEIILEMTCKKVPVYGEEYYEPKRYKIIDEGKTCTIKFKSGISLNLKIK